MWQKTAKILKAYWAYMVCAGFYFSIAVSTMDIIINRQPIHDFVSKPIIVLITVLLYAVCICLAFSKHGERILRYVKGAYEIETEEDKEQLLPLFEEVYREAIESNPHIGSDVKLYIAENISIEVYAFGKNTIVATRGAVDTFTPEELKGIFAHEFGHIASGDTKVLLIHLIGNSFFLFTMFCCRKISKVLKDISDYLFGSIWGLMVLVAKALVDYTIFVYTFIGDTIITLNSRKNEITADDFAHDLGYGEELKSALKVLKKFSVHGKVRLLERLKATHPHIGARIKNLEQK